MKKILIALVVSLVGASAFANDCKVNVDVMNLGKASLKEIKKAVKNAGCSLASANDANVGIKIGFQSIPSPHDYRTYDVYGNLTGSSNPLIVQAAGFQIFKSGAICVDKMVERTERAYLKVSDVPNSNIETMIQEMAKSLTQCM